MTEKRDDTMTEQRLAATNRHGGQSVSFLTGLFTGACVGPQLGFSSLYRPTQCYVISGVR
jgi:hypothetical protein